MKPENGCAHCGAYMHVSEIARARERYKQTVCEHCTGDCADCNGEFDEF